MSREHLMIIVEDDVFRLIFSHQINAKGVAKPVRVAGVIDVAVDIKIRIHRAVFADKFVALQIADSGRKIHRNGKILVLRDQFAHIPGRKHTAGSGVQQQPEGTGLADHFSMGICKHVVPGKETDTGRRGKSMNGNLFPD